MNKLLDGYHSVDYVRSYLRHQLELDVRVSLSYTLCLNSLTVSYVVHLTGVRHFVVLSEF